MNLPSLFSVLCLHGFWMKSVASNRAEFIRRPGFKVEAFYIIEELLMQSELECSCACAMYQNKCDKSAWNAIENRCQIATVIADVRVTINSRMEPAPNWTSYDRVLYPVKCYMGQSGISYTLNYPEAVNTCAIMGTTIASRETLLTARAEGYGNCRCGWLSDGTMGFVIQASDPECSPTFSTGIKNCSYALADVYCEVP